jgi:SAM-dependent methyltransferase
MMEHVDSDKAFTGSIAELYDRWLVPLIFEPFALDLVNRISERPMTAMLEVAAGTGVVTRRLAAALPERASITATDLNQPMLDRAQAHGTARPVSWRQADALQLPFPDQTFDAVVCQFGVMFFPDKPRAFAEARRVLRAGGVFLFSVWDRIEENEFADSITVTLADMFPDDPPRFLERTPHGYHDKTRIEADLAAGGFKGAATITPVSARSQAASATIPAIAYCHGTPLRNEIEARDAARLDEATERAASAIARRFGPGAVDGKIQAHAVRVEKR